MESNKTKDYRSLYKLSQLIDYCSERIATLKSDKRFYAKMDLEGTVEFCSKKIQSQIIRRARLLSWENHLNNKL